MKNFNIILSLLLFLSTMIFLLNFIFNLKGFYFSGDTISYLEYSNFGKPGGIRTVFLQHGEYWPPLTAIIFNLFHLLPYSIIVQQKITAMSFLIFAYISSYLLVKNFVDGTVKRIILSSFILFSGNQSLLLNSTMSDPLFMTLWIFSAVTFLSLLKIQKIQYFILFVISISLVALTRYIGIAVVFGFVPASLLAIYLQKDKRYYFYFIPGAILCALIPVSFYIFHTFTKIGYPFGKFDHQFSSVDLLSIIPGRLTQVSQDLWLPSFAALILGVIIPWNKKFKPVIFYLGSFVLIYFVALFISESKYAIIEYLRSRFFSPAYPFILSCLILFGSFLGTRIDQTKIFKNISLIMIPVILSILYYQRSYILINNLKNYQLSPAGVAYSGKIQQVCNQKPNQKRFSLIQLYSRNWIGQSLYYYCQPITKLYPGSAPVSLEEKDLIFTPYKINNPRIILLQRIDYLKTIYIYEALGSSKLDTIKDIPLLEKLD